jgi:hypothetical protein
VISARLSGQVRARRSLWPLRPKKFIFNGLELHDAMTFESHGIRDSDLILAPTRGERVARHDALDQGHTRLRQLQQASSLQWMLNPNATDKSARLRDVHFMKRRRRPRVLLKMYAAFSEEQSSAQSPALVMDSPMPTGLTASASEDGVNKRIYVGWDTSGGRNRRVGEPRQIEDEGEATAWKTC